MPTAGVAPDRTSRALLALAAVAVAFAAADTYVVVLALPDMMASAGLSGRRAAASRPDHLRLPARLRRDAARSSAGSRTCAAGCRCWSGRLLVFALGSLITAAAYDLPSMVTGRVPPGRRRRRAAAGDPRPGRRPLPAPGARDCRSASWVRCRSSATCSARCTAPWCSPSATGATSSGSTSPLGLVLAAVIRARAPRSLLTGDDAARPRARRGT